MAKKKKNEEQPQVGNEIQITQAAVKDDFCNYSYDVMSGVGQGDTHNVKGTGIIDDDLREAFARLNVHLAAIDDVFKHSGEEVTNIDAVRGHQLVGLYHVTGFKIRGTRDSESIILLGTKFVNSSGERMELETPRIPLDDLSSYRWHAELQAAADQAREEVELYRQGKCTPVEEREESNPDQLNITDNQFEEAKV